MFAAVDETFQADAPLEVEAGQGFGIAEELCTVPAEVGVTQVDGMRVVAARSVEPLSDDDLAKIAAQAAAFMAERRNVAAHDR